MRLLGDVFAKPRSTERKDAIFYYILPVSALRHPYTSPKPPRPIIRCTEKSFIVSCIFSSKFFHWQNLVNLSLKIYKILPKIQWHQFKFKLCREKMKWRSQCLGICRDLETYLLPTVWPSLQIYVMTQKTDLITFREISGKYRPLVAHIFLLHTAETNKYFKFRIFHYHLQHFRDTYIR